jgi:large subunit ribosomal protein L22
METRAVTKFVRVSPRKVRLVVDQIRGKGVEEALNILKFIPKRSAGIVAKTVRTAVANAENTQSVDVDRLFVKLAQVDEGGMWKRFTSRAQAAQPYHDHRRRSRGEELSAHGAKDPSQDFSSGRNRIMGFKMVCAA